MLVNALMLLFVVFSHPSPRPTNDSCKIEIADAVVSVSGKVKTPSGQPVSYANVAVKGSVKGHSLINRGILNCST